MDSLILRATSRFLVGLLLLDSLYMLVRGHNEPGGGFVGGLLAASAFALFMLAEGVSDARRLLRVDPRALIGAGGACLLSAAVLPLALGQELLTGQWLKYPVPGIGKLSTVLLFDVGVYLGVLGAVLLVLFALAEEA